MYIGDYAAGDVIYFKFTSRRFDTGAPATLGGTPAISIYKTNSTTQSTTGVTLTVDFDAVTGLNHCTVDTSTDATFYANGGTFIAVITTGTVNAVSVVGETVARFTLRAQASLYATTSGRTLDVASTGEAGLDFNNTTTPTTTCPALGIIAAGTAQAGSSSSLTLAAGTSFVDNLISGSTLVLMTGTGASQARTITSYTSSSKVAVISPNWTTTPDATTTYMIVGTPPATTSSLPNVNVSSFDNGVLTANAIATDAITNSKIASGAIDNDSLAADVGFKSVRSSTAQAGGATSITFDASSSSTTDFYAGAWAVITSGTGVGQARVITAYNGTTKVATTAPAWATNPDSTSNFAIMPVANMTGVQGNVTGSVGSVTGAVGSVTGAVGSIGANGITASSIASNTFTSAKFDSTWSTAVENAVWNAVLGSHTTASTFGKLINDDINAPIGTVQTTVTAIKAKTDSLTFTTAGNVDANIQYVNDVLVNGNGAGVPWGP